MPRIANRRLALALFTLALLGLAGALWSQAPATQYLATSRGATVGGREVGEVLVNERLVIRMRTWAGGDSPEQRAAQVADRINDALSRGVRAQDVRVATMNGSTVVMAGDRAVVTVTPNEAAAVRSSVRGLATQWASNLRVALGGERLPPGNSNGNGIDWTGQANKIVPIFSVGTPGVSIGAARVTGPKERVDSTRAVAQLEAEFQRVARIRAFIPVSSLNVTKPQRVQGVSVDALIDVRLVEF